MDFTITNKFDQSMMFDLLELKGHIIISSIDCDFDFYPSGYSYVDNANYFSGKCQKLEAGKAVSDWMSCGLTMTLIAVGSIGYEIVLKVYGDH